MDFQLAEWLQWIWIMVLSVPAALDSIPEVINFVTAGE